MPAQVLWRGPSCCTHLRDSNPLGSIASFAEFQKKIVYRCEPGHEPQVENAQLAGEYRVLHEGFGD